MGSAFRTPHLVRLWTHLSISLTEYAAPRRQKRTDAVTSGSAPCAIALRSCAWGPARGAGCWQQDPCSRSLGVPTVRARDLARAEERPRPHTHGRHSRLPCVAPRFLVQKTAPTTGPRFEHVVAIPSVVPTTGLTPRHASSPPNCVPRGGPSFRTVFGARGGKLLGPPAMWARGGGPLAPPPGELAEDEQASPGSRPAAMFFYACRGARHRPTARQGALHALGDRYQAKIFMGHFGLKGLDQEHANQPELILAVALLAVPHPHQFGGPSSGRGCGSPSLQRFSCGRAASLSHAACKLSGRDRGSLVLRLRFHLCPLRVLPVVPFAFSLLPRSRSPCCPACVFPVVPFRVSLLSLSHFPVHLERRFGNLACALVPPQRWME